MSQAPAAYLRSPHRDYDPLQHKLPYLLCRCCQGYDLSLDQVEAMLDWLMETEGQAEVVQISGGEPNPHPSFFDILEAALARDISYVILNTNGLRLAQDPAFVRRLSGYHLGFYLQIDGLKAEAHRALRRSTLTDVLYVLENQTDGLFQVDDFRQVPCPHPTCSASAYAVVYNGDVTPITRLLDVDDYLDFLTNRTAPDLLPDGQRGTAWSSSGDGNEAFIEVELAQPAQVYAIEVWTRTMSDGTAQIFEFTITTNGGDVLGPFTLEDASQAYRFDVDLLARTLRPDVVESSGGNTGLIEFAVYGTLVGN